VEIILHKPSPNLYVTFTTNLLHNVFTR